MISLAMLTVWKSLIIHTPYFAKVLKNTNITNYYIIKFPPNQNYRFNPSLKMMLLLPLFFIYIKGIKNEINEKTDFLWQNRLLRWHTNHFWSYNVLQMSRKHKIKYRIFCLKPNLPGPPSQAIAAYCPMWRGLPRDVVYLGWPIAPS